MATEEAAKPSPMPPYSEMILAAIEGLGDKNGSNKSAISKYIEGKYGKLPPAHLTAYLAGMKYTGELIFLKNNYFRADAPDAPPKRGRGRPPKARDPLEAAVKQATAGMPKARGRPPKKAKTEDGESPAPAPAGDGSTPGKRGRGRPPKKKPECWKFQHSKPEYLEQLAEMFHGVAVDGSSSCIPGQAQFVEDADGDEEGEDADGDGFDNNPMSTSSRKRGSSSTDTTTSLAKKSKAPLLNKAIQELQSDIKELQSDIKDAIQNLHQFRNNEAIKEKQEKEEVDQQIDRCLRMAMECGATEESEEYFMATTLFEKEYNRKIFCKFNTAEGRFMWLKRWCQRSRG